MLNDLKNILSNLNKDINQEKLLEYLNSTLSKEEQHSLEMQMNDDPFISDAVDGLQHFEKDQQVSLIVHHLNEGLRKQLEKKKARRKTSIQQQPWIYFALIILLILIVVAYVIIKKLYA